MRVVPTILRDITQCVVNKSHFNSMYDFLFTSIFHGRVPVSLMRYSNTFVELGLIERPSFEEHIPRIGREFSITDRFS